MGKITGCTESVWRLGKEADEGAEERADAHHDVRWGPGAADTMRGKQKHRKGPRKTDDRNDEEKPQTEPEKNGRKDEK